MNAYGVPFIMFAGIKKEALVAQLVRALVL